MTENEAIEILNKNAKESEKILNNFLDRSREEITQAKRTKQSCEIAIQALEEIRQYRTIGTVEEIQEILSIVSEGQDDVDESGISTDLLHTLSEYAEYKKIGTVEECGKAVRRMKPKKPNLERRRIIDCAGIPYDFTVKICPTCGQQLERVQFRKYPCECGQAIDWNESEERC